MRKLLRSVARYLLALNGARRVNRLMSALWRKALAGELNRHAKALRKYMRQYDRIFKRYLRHGRLRRVMRSLATPFRAVWEALRNLFWRVTQPV